MKHRSALAGVLLLGVAGAQAHAQAVQLKFTPPVGQVTRYRTTNQIWPSGDTAAAPVVTTLFTTRTIASMDGPNYVVKTTQDSMVTSQGGGRGADMMRGMVITQHMDQRGRVLSTEISPPPGLPPFVASMMQRNAPQSNTRSTAVMPEGPIHPGDTWTDSMVSSASTGRGRPSEVTFVVTYKLERVENQGGTRMAVISMQGGGQGGPASTINGELTVDLDAGRLAHMNSTMTFPGQGGTPTRTTTTMELLP